MNLNVQIGKAVSESLTNQSRAGILTMSIIMIVTTVLTITMGAIISPGIARQVKA